MVTSSLNMYTIWFVSKNRLLCCWTLLQHDGRLDLLCLENIWYACVYVVLDTKTKLKHLLLDVIAFYLSVLVSDSIANGPIQYMYNMYVCLCVLRIVHIHDNDYFHLLLLFSCTHKRRICERNIKRHRVSCVCV